MREATAISIHHNTEETLEEAQERADHWELAARRYQFEIHSANRGIRRLVRGKEWAAKRQATLTGIAQQAMTTLRRVGQDVTATRMEETLRESKVIS